jgi:drug/metabolite transporter (DMT)-like permease
LISYGSVFVAMVATALQMVLLRVLGRRETRESTVLYPRIVTILGGVIAAFLWGFEPMSSRAVFCSLLSGVLGGTGWLCMAEAYKTAPAATVAPFHYSQIITGAFIGYLIWGDIPSYGLLAGAALIILSGIYIVTHVRKSANILREETHT